MSLLSAFWKRNLLLYQKIKAKRNVEQIHEYRNIECGFIFIFIQHHLVWRSFIKRDGMPMVYKLGNEHENNDLGKDGGDSKINFEYHDNNRIDAYAIILKNALWCFSKLQYSRTYNNEVPRCAVRWYFKVRIDFNKCGHNIAKTGSNYNKFSDLSCRIQRFGVF